MTAPAPVWFVNLIDAARRQNHAVQISAEQCEEIFTALFAPLDVVLHCPVCKFQHIDGLDPNDPEWTDPPHTSHKCLRPDCKTIWRPADVPTRGVAAVKTKGKKDNWPWTTKS